MSDYFEIAVKSRTREQFIDVTAEVQKKVSEMKILNGCILLFIPHTTAGIMINENADPDVLRDILKFFNEKIPQKDGYLHAEGNSDAHIKAILMGSSEHLLVREGKLVLGTWQSIFFGEFDGPRNRKLLIGSFQ